MRAPAQPVTRGTGRHYGDRTAATRYEHVPRESPVFVRRYRLTRLSTTGGWESKYRQVLSLEVAQGTVVAVDLCGRPPYRVVVGPQADCLSTPCSLGTLVVARLPKFRWRPTREQAHVPAEQPPPCPDPWVPAAHADARWTRDHRAPPAQGSGRAVGLTRWPAMLPKRARLRRRTDFDEVFRNGSRAAGRMLVVHLCPPSSASTTGTRVGFVVGRQIGGSVMRHRVLRQLRALVRTRLDEIPSGSQVVVRALPAAAGSDSADLGGDLDVALARAARRSRERAEVST